MQKTRDLLNLAPKKHRPRSKVGNSISVIRSWDWAYNALWSSDSAVPKCTIDILDTVLFSGNSSKKPSTWLFTSKAGVIAKKKESNLTFDAIEESFLKNATGESVAIIIYKDGSRKVLDAEGFAQVIHTLSTGTFKSIAGLQQQVQSPVDDMKIRAKMSKQETSVVFVSPQGETTDAVPPRLKKEIESTLRQIVKFIDKSSKVKTSKIVAEFVQDSNHRLYLSFIPEIACRDVVSTKKGTETTTTPLSIETSKSLSALPQLQNHIQNEKCSGDFCQKSISRFPGLVQLLSLESENSTGLPPASRDRIYPDTGERFTIGNKEVMLARAEEQFLNKSGNPLKWGVADNKFRNEFGRRNPSEFYKDVDVCANCHNIYSKLKHVRSNNFKKKKKKVKTIKEEVVPVASSNAAIDYLENQSGPEEEEEQESTSSFLPSIKKPTTTVPFVEPKSSSKQEQLLVAAQQKQIEALSQKIQDMASDASASKRDFMQAMSEKDSYISRKILELEQKHLAELSNSHRASTSATDDAGRQELIDTIDKLNLQMDSLHLQAESDKQRASREHQAELNRVKESFRLENERPRQHISELEDKIESLRKEMYELQRKESVANSLANESKSLASRLTAERDTLLLRLKDQPSVTSQESTSAETIDAASVEARERQLQNKIDYLKAQLVSETKCKEELGGNVASLTANLKTLKREKKKAAAEMEELQKQAIAKLETSHRQALEDSSSQLASYKNKVAQLQTSMSDLISDSTMAKQKESQASLTVDKLAEENASLLRRIADLQEALEDANEAAAGKQNSLEEANRSNMEATLRRLDNERQYLNSTLQSETKCKEELQQNLAKLRDELKNQSERFTKDIATAEEMASNKIRSANAAADESRASLISLRSELQNASAQLHEVSQSYGTLKEDFRQTKASLESSINETRTLKSTLIATKEDLLRERKHARDSSERQSSSLSSVKASLASLAETKDAEITALQSQLSASFQKAAEAQQSVASAQEESEKARTQHRIETGFVILASIVERNRSTSLLSNLKKWSHAASIATTKSLMLDQFAAEHEANAIKSNEALTNAITAAKQGFAVTLETELEDQRKKLEAVHQDEIASVQAAADEKLSEMFTSEKKTFESDLDDAKSAYDDRVSAIKAENDVKIENLEAEWKQKLENAKKQVDNVEQSSTERADMLVETHAAAMEEMRKLANADLEQLRSELSAAHTLKVEELCAAHNADIKSLEEKLETASSASQKIESEAEKALAASKEQAQSLLASKEELVQANLREMEALRATLETQHASTLEEEKANWQKTTEAERLEWKSTISKIKEAQEAKTAAALDELRNSLNKMKGNALMQCAAKWQKALEELTERTNAEKKTQYDRGVADREAEWQVAAAEIKERQEAEISKMKAEASEAIATCEERHSLLLEKEKMELRASLEAEYTSKLQNEVSTASKDLSQQLSTLQERHEATLIAEKQAFTEAIATANATATQEHEEILNSLKTDHKSELENAIAELNTEWQGKLDAAVSESRRELQEEFTKNFDSMTSRSNEEVSRALERQKATLSAEFAARAADAETQYNNRLDEALKQCEEAAAEEQAAAIAEVQEDSEKLIERVEVAMNNLKSQKDVTEKELVKVRETLEEAEDSAFDLRNELKALQKSFAFSLIHLTSNATKLSSSLKSKLELTEKVWKDNLESAKEKLQDEIDDMQVHVSELENFKKQTAELHTQLHHTLSDYKRDVIMEQKIQSKVLVSDMKVLEEQRAEVLASKEKLQIDISVMESAVQELEDQIREASSQSAIKDGRVNTALAAKKRRLNEEFETMLEAIDQRRNTVTTVSAQVKDLESQKNSKEEELKGLERQLVQILVEQQHRMLKLLNAPPQPTKPE